MVDSNRIIIIIITSYPASYSFLKLEEPGYETKYLCKCSYLTCNRDGVAVSAVSLAGTNLNGNAVFNISLETRDSCCVFFEQVPGHK